ncbi:hypothetical protein [Dyadobacter sp. CY351]|uniref:hypothetical protein n=1 Tax=Dyadobacter sp. CY351 TaxID=2909337 RepID=UPI001F290FAD|nr:hypothetical protein [Dyadobacter sp. CY351]MCF2518543.1 hypothetical protein [Dyadobacter sp. CY351]
MKYILFFTAFIFSVPTLAQPVNSVDQVKAIATQNIPNADVVDFLVTSLRNKVDSLKTNPEHYDRVWNFILEGIATDNKSAGRWLNGLNVDFKTFQNQDSTRTSLGLSYDFNLERAYINEKGSHRSGVSVSLATQGNVAIKKEVNPINFLLSKIALNFFHVGGGVFLTDESKSKSELAMIRQRLASLTTREAILVSSEWKQFNEIVKLKNSWIVKGDLNGGLESNQDFSKVQKSIGVRLGGGVKSWNQKDLLSNLNVLDIPFALLRSLTGFEKGFVLHGSSLPVVLAGFDYVDPQKDATREKADPARKPFPRINFEISFRTVMAKAGSQILYFNSSFRYYKELNPNQTIKASNLDRFRYYAASITSSSGLFISYTSGQLPFDRKNEQVYQLGFNYKFN